MFQSVNLRRLLVLLVTLSLLALSVACGSSDDEAEDEDNSNGTETAAAGTPYKVTGNEGSVVGTINFTGAAPAPKPISMDADPACASSNPNAKAEDAVVNVHPSPKSNQEWNQSQTAGQAPIIQKFTRPEIIPVKCNQHPWMKSYVAVQRNPFFAVSGPDGKFEIKGLPPGTYTIAAWHEKFGEKTQTVTVAAKESKTQDFSYDGSGGTSAEVNRGSLPVADAIEFPMIMKHQ